jgi:protein O-GlcNAc transferase
MTEVSVAAPPARNAPCPCGSGKRYKECHGAKPMSAADWVGRALSELQRRDFTGAEASLREAQRLAPEDPRVLANLGTVYVRQRRLAEAEAPLARALALDPDQPYALTLLAHTRQRLCAWDGLGDLHARIRRLLETDDGTPADFNPFALLAMPATAREQLVAARRFARMLTPRVAVQRTDVARQSGERLRIGFVSSDFRSHATASLMLEFWERLDRSQTEIFGYGILERDTGPIGRRIERAFEHFTDASADSDERIAERIRDDRIGVLFDLNGYTRNARPGIFALRPAPLQVNAIGFQGSLGTSWHDYILCDGFGVPQATESFYTERALRLPHALYPSDTTRLPRGGAPSRGSCGLPEEGFVFCCFNNAYKILPEVFAIWMRLLGRVPGSVLWLLEANAEAKANLSREAAAAGVDPQRLIFAPRVGVGAHVARNAVADLFLDTYPYGAHTTGNDALLAGLPLVTCAGETLVSRIAGSQLHAIGLPELVTTGLADYERLALALATQPALLAGYRQRLAANRATLPLFDMARYARDFEAAMHAVWAEHRAGR